MHKRVWSALCVGLALAAAVPAGCDKDSTPGGSRGTAARPPAGNEEPPSRAGAAGAVTLRHVLDKWVSDSHDAAVDELLRLSEQSSIAGGDEIFETSEEQSISMSADAGGAMHPRLLAASKDTRALAKHAWARAEDHRKAGRPEAAEKTLNAALWLGEYLNSANRTQILQMTGRAIQQGTLGKLADFHEQAGDTDKAREMRDRLSSL